MEEKKDIESMEASVDTPEGKKNYVIGYSVELQRKIYTINKILIIVLVIGIIIALFIVWKFFPFALKLDEGQWLSRVILTCRECASCP